ncbi:hypothetical protein [Bacteroides heparinolyticus]|uniref:hypothetical protein n=1 Tax=Prevotella heparinolytica TaxID=28113 RepID=UPI0035A1604B
MQTDPLYPRQYYLNNTGQFGGTDNIDINAPETWNITTGNTSVRVAVIEAAVEHAVGGQGKLPDNVIRSKKTPNRRTNMGNTDIGG